MWDTILMQQNRKEKEMAGLWRMLPPLMADNFGFIEVINQTDGMGIIDDCSEYRTGRERKRRTQRQEMRVVHTEMNNEDVISGTEVKILKTFAQYQSEYDPKFVLLSAGPCSAMIGTDLEQAAEKIEKKSNIRTAAVKLSGQKKYDMGISETLLSFVKLLVKKEEPEDNCINIFGATKLDWQETNCKELRNWIEQEGIHIVADFGGKETSANMEKAAKASMNLVVSVSGIAAAKYLEKEYGTPYIVMAPFGKKSAKKLSAALQKKNAEQFLEGYQNTAFCGIKERQEKVLIVGEQVMCNAIRETLHDEYGYTNIQACTFFIFEKSIASPGDRRIRSEEDAKKLLMENKYDLVIADPLLGKLAPSGTAWIDLPHKAFELYGETYTLPLLLGENLDIWLEKQMKEPVIL